MSYKSDPAPWPDSLARQIHDANMTLSAEPSMVAITRDVYLGNFASSISGDLIFRNRITSIVAIASSPPPAYTGSLQNQRRASLPQVTYHYIHCRDSDSSNIIQHFPRLFDDIERLTKLGRVLIHCSQGLSRSPAAVAGYLMKKEGKGVDAVLAEVKKKRDVKIRGSFLEQLRIWEECRYELYEDGLFGGRRAKGPYREFIERLAREDAARAAEGDGDSTGDRRGSL
jgi:hypothetical protein